MNILKKTSGGINCLPLESVLSTLFPVGLGDKYVPTEEVSEILGKLAGR